MKVYLLGLTPPVEHNGVELDCFNGLIGVGVASDHGVARYCVGVWGELKTTTARWELQRQRVRMEAEARSRGGRGERVSRAGS